MSSRPLPRSPRMPAEWEPHAATWIAWPHCESDWPGKFGSIPWVYTEIARVLSNSEPLEILCSSAEHRAEIRRLLNDTGSTDEDGSATTLLNPSSGHPLRLHLQKTDRSWLRDSAPTLVASSEGPRWIQWHFNAWAKYDNFADDAQVPPLIARLSATPLVEALRPDNGAPLVLEGGAIDVDGGGTILVTEECLLSDIQCRNPGLSRAGYETAFREYLGVSRTIWLGRGCNGDDTHGHIDDVARFVSEGTVVLSFEEDPALPYHAVSVDNLARLEAARDAKGRKLKIIKIPMPGEISFAGELLPASYANFYIANRVVAVPTFNDPNDRVVLNILAELFPKRAVIGINCVDLILGQGTLHCLTQQQPVCVTS